MYQIIRDLPNSWEEVNERRFSSIPELLQEFRKCCSSLSNPEQIRIAEEIDGELKIRKDLELLSERTLREWEFRPRHGGGGFFGSEQKVLAELDAPEACGDAYGPEPEGRHETVRCTKCTEDEN